MTKPIENENPRRKIVRYILAAVTLVFGIATVKSGGDVLFWSVEAKTAAGNYVDFVLWSNFILGFVYVLCAFALLLRPRCAFYLAAAIALSTLLVFAALGVHIAVGRPYEMRTVLAMVFRSVLWVMAAFLLRPENGITSTAN